MSFRKKLCSSFAATALVVLALAFLSERVARSLESTLSKTAGRDTQRARLTAEVCDGMREMMDLAKSTQLAHAIARMARMAASGKAADQTESACGACHAVLEGDAARGEFEAAAGQVRDKLHSLDSLLAGDAGASKLKVFGGGLEEWVKLNRKYLEVAGRDYDAAHAVLVDEMMPVMGRVEGAVTGLAEQQRQEVSNSAAGASAFALRMRGVMMALIVVSLLVIGGAILTVNRANAQLRSLVRTLGGQSEQVATAAREVSQSSTAVGDGASRQAGTLDEVADSGVRIRSEAEGHLRDARETAQATTEMEQSMAEASARVAELREAMEKIREASSGVTRIARVIEEVAFSTNLLALNASVEAARAGAAGTAFAVVADEVRNLSQRSSQAAQEVSELIQHATTASDQGVSRLNQVVGAFEAIATRAASVRTLAAGIETSSSRQAEEVQQIGAQIVNIREVAREAAATAERTATTGNELTQESAELNRAVKRLAALLGEAA